MSLTAVDYGGKRRAATSCRRQTPRRIGLLLAGALSVLALSSMSHAEASQAKAAPKQAITFYRVPQFRAVERIDFRGDPSANCQSSGHCGLSGSIVLSERARPGLLALLVSYGREIGFGGIPEPRATVQATVNYPGGGQPYTDLQVLKNASAGLDFIMLNNRVRVSLPTADELGVGPVLANRCGGPLDTDLVPLGSPQRTYGLSKFQRPRVSIEFAISQPFRGGGFIGTVTTEVHARLRRIHCPRAGCRGALSNVLTITDLLPIGHSRTAAG